MNPLASVIIGGACGIAVLVLLVVGLCEAAKDGDSQCDLMVRDLRAKTESFSPPECLNEWERGCWEPVQSPVVEAESFLAEAANR